MSEHVVNKVAPGSAYCIRFKRKTAGLRKKSLGASTRRSCALFLSEA